MKLYLCLTNRALRIEGVWESGRINPRFLQFGICGRCVDGFTFRFLSHRELATGLTYGSVFESWYGQEFSHLRFVLPSLLSCGYFVIFPGLRRPDREADHSLLTIVEVKKTWIYTCTPLIRLDHTSSYAYSPRDLHAAKLRRLPDM
jgi:hypothetical protein